MWPNSLARMPLVAGRQSALGSKCSLGAVLLLFPRLGVTRRDANGEIEKCHLTKQETAR